MREIAGPFVVAAPSGTRIKASVHVTETEDALLRELGKVLGLLAGRDLMERCRLGAGVKHLERKERKSLLTVDSSSRWAGTITRVTADQWQRGLLNLKDSRVSMGRAITTISKRLAAPVGGKAGRVRGYATQQERFAKQQRLQVLQARLNDVEQRIADHRVSVCRGGRALAKLRHNLEAAELTETEWREEWEAERWFITADGDKAYPYGNGLISVDPATGTLRITLPRAMAGKYGTNKRRSVYEFEAPVEFRYREDMWAEQATSGAVRYDIDYNPHKHRWYISASWQTHPAPPPALEELVEHPTLAVDLNAEHLACHVVVPDGNPKGHATPVTCELDGSTARRDGQLRAAITALLDHAEIAGCRSIAIENLNFVDARDTGRETMGRGKRGKRFRRTVAGIPTAKFKDMLTAMAYRRGIAVIAVDPAYTSKWGKQHWLKYLNATRRSQYTAHDAASIVIGRRIYGHKAKRRNHSQTGSDCNTEGVTGTDERIGANTKPFAAGELPTSQTERPKKQRLVKDETLTAAAGHGSNNQQARRSNEPHDNAAQAGPTVQPAEQRYQALPTQRTVELHHRHISRWQT